MTRPLPVPRTPNDELLAAVVDRLDRVVDVLGQVLDRLPAPAGDDLSGGPGAAVLVTEPARPVRPAMKVAKKTAAKAAPLPVKET
jgi:hypothetical protein